MLLSAPILFRNYEFATYTYMLLCNAKEFTGQYRLAYWCSSQRAGRVVREAPGRVVGLTPPQPVELAAMPHWMDSGSNARWYG